MSQLASGHMRFTSDGPAGTIFIWGLNKTFDMTEVATDIKPGMCVVPSTGTYTDGCDRCDTSVHRTTYPTKAVYTRLSCSWPLQLARCTPYGHRWRKADAIARWRCWNGLMRTARLVISLKLSRSRARASPSRGPSAAWHALPSMRGGMCVRC